MPSSSTRTSRRPIKVVAALALTLGAGALVPATSANAAPCGRASGCTKYELVSSASTYDWWPWAKDKASSKIRHEFRTADGPNPPAKWSRTGPYTEWSSGAPGHGTLETAVPGTAGLPVRESSTTWASGKKTGRWEIRYRSQSINPSATGDYRVKVELVPAGAAKLCEPKSITMVTYDPSAPTTAKIGITRPGVMLGVAMTVKTPPLNTTAAGWKKGNDPKISGWHVWAVEVAKGHISWFLDGRIVRRETRKSAMFNEALNLRISMVSDPTGPTADSVSQLDWARWFSLKRTTKNKKLVKQLKSAKPLAVQRKNFNPGCS